MTRPYRIATAWLIAGGAVVLMAVTVYRLASHEGFVTQASLAFVMASITALLVKDFVTDAYEGADS